MIKTGSKVKLKSTRSNKIGTVVKILENNILLDNKSGNSEFSPLKGQFLVEFELINNEKRRIPCSLNEIIEID